MSGARATILDNHEAVRSRLVTALQDDQYWNYIVGLGVGRAMGIGKREYGDSTYAKSYAEVSYEADCEIADFAFYAGVLEEMKHNEPCDPSVAADDLS